jgi:hypothetical protein
MMISTGREETAREIAAVPEIGMTDGTIVGEAAIETEVVKETGVATKIIEPGEMTPATGFGGGETILLTRSESLDEQIAERGIGQRPETRILDLERLVISLPSLHHPLFPFHLFLSPLPFPIYDNQLLTLFCRLQKQRQPQHRPLPRPRKKRRPSGWQN